MVKLLRKIIFISVLMCAVGVMLFSAYFVVWEALIRPVRNTKKIKDAINIPTATLLRSYDLRYQQFLQNHFFPPHYRYYKDIAWLDFSLASSAKEPEVREKYFKESLAFNVNEIIPRNPLDSYNWLFSALVLYHLQNESESVLWLKNATDIAPYSPYSIYQRMMLSLKLWNKLTPVEQEITVDILSSLCTKHPWDAAYHFNTPEIMKVIASILGEDSDAFKEYKRIVDSYWARGMIK